MHETEEAYIRESTTESFPVCKSRPFFLIYLIRNEERSADLSGERSRNKAGGWCLVHCVANIPKKKNWLASIFDTKVASWRRRGKLHRRYIFFKKGKALKDESAKKEDLVTLWLFYVFLPKLCSGRKQMKPTQESIH